MTGLTKAPNAELLVTQFLRTQAELTTLVGDNVFTELPAGFSSWPAVRVTRAGGSPVAGTLTVIDRPLMQVEVWGGPKLTANDVAETVRSLLAQRTPYTLSGKGTMTVDTFGALRYLPDPTWDPARPRYLFDVSLITRP